MTEADLWAHFAKQMPRGLRRGGQPASLEERDDIDSTYWGGALFALTADVALRQRTAGARSLDDVLRAVLARHGDATHAARVADFLQTGDQATGTRVLSETYERIAVRGGAVDLGRLWASLGVVMGKQGDVSLRDEAPLAAVRKGIATGRPPLN
jgi:predicted metalloprotease with PDZ domain